jgi:hypothetical protein
MQRSGPFATLDYCPGRMLLVARYCFIIQAPISSTASWDTWPGMLYSWKCQESEHAISPLRLKTFQSSLKCCFCTPLHSHQSILQGAEALPEHTALFCQWHCLFRFCPISEIVPLLIERRAEP